MYLGSFVLPQAAYGTSKMHQKLLRLRVAHLCEANTIVKELMLLKPYITFPKGHNMKNVTITTFSDAAHKIDNCSDQTGVGSGMRIATSEQPDIFHIIDSTSHKRKRVSYSAYGAEILAVAHASDQAYNFRIGIKSLFPKKAGNNSRRSWSSLHDNDPS